MATSYAFENLFRSPWEIFVAVIAAGFGTICLIDHRVLALDIQMSPIVASPFFLLAIIRGYQGVRLFQFRRRLLQLKPFAMSTTEVPLSKDNLYVGRGFRWLPIHRQRLYLLTLVENQCYIQKSALYRYIQSRAKENPKGIYKRLTITKFLPFKPMPDIGGKPWLHGVGSLNERPIYINQHNRNSHECTFGMTRVGKTRYLSIKVNQDIRNGEAVLIIDPKGDLEVVQDIYCAAKAAGRLDDLIISHFGFPDISAKYNPLASYSNVSEVAGRVTSAIAASGEGQAFKDFAWQYINIVARCLEELQQRIDYKTIAFYIKNPEIMLTTYMDKVFAKVEVGYLSEVQAIIDEHDAKVDKAGNSVEPIQRPVAIKRYLTKHIEMKAASGITSKSLMDSIIVPLYNAAMLDKTYYDKITASIGPILDKINQTQAQGIFSWENSFGLPEIQLDSVIRRKQIAYIGLDSLTNREMAETVGQAIIADLVSLCGRIYSESGSSDTSLCLHCDEFSNIVHDEFVNLLNKAGGAGVKISAYTQTINDLGAVFGNNRDKPKMLMGNFGTITMLRVSNEDTASNFTHCLEQVRTRSSVPSTKSNDRADENGALFTTSNSDTITEDDRRSVEINDLFSLPKGQAFMMTNGGEVYKIRIPLPKNDGSAPKSFESILSEVNLCFV